MKQLAYWLPRPLFSLFLAVLWLFLMNTVSVAHILLGLVLGVVIPFITQGFWPEQARAGHPLLVLRYVRVFLWDLLCSNLVVARRILGRTRLLQPGFVLYPVELDDDFAITVLASTISLTPGTVSTHYDAAQRTLLIHVLHLEDEAALIEQIKSRYERPLQEMFQ